MIKRLRTMMLVLVAMVGLALWNVFILREDVDQGNDILVQPVLINSIWEDGLNCGPTLLETEWDEIVDKFRIDLTDLSVGNLIHYLENSNDLASFGKGKKTAPSTIAEMDSLASVLFGEKTAPIGFLEPPLLYFGIDGRPRIDRHGTETFEPHRDQTLATCASLGVPATRMFLSEEGGASIAKLVCSTRADFHLDGELEWTAVALARYAPTSRYWINRWGRKFTFDDVAGILLNHTYGEGTCAGSHVLYALVTLLRVNMQRNILSEEIETEIVN